MRRALVLGGGGTTGIAWEIGVLDALAAGGVAVAAADRVIGTSAGAITGAMLTLGVPPDALAGEWLAHMRTIGRVDARLVAGALLDQLLPDRVGRLRSLGSATRVASGLSAAAFVQAISAHLIGRPWPAPLVVAAYDAAAGARVSFDASSGVDLGLAVAASCAMPGVFPPIEIAGRPHLDGGCGSPANVDLAADCDRLIVLTPFQFTREPHRRPRAQLNGLPAGAGWLHLHPDLAAQRAIGVDVLDAGRSERVCEAGRRQGRAARGAALGVWGRG